ncbi:hypothetical protein FRC12_017700 [Ceratobasidium sp. 428]|nr:hypothetical protein FRC12_017700 [Ceratobasidium sp. 428]
MSQIPHILGRQTGPYFDHTITNLALGGSETDSGDDDGKVTARVLDPSFILAVFIAVGVTAYQMYPVIKMKRDKFIV